MQQSSSASRVAGVPCQGSVTDSGWTCLACRSANDISAGSCVGCGRRHADQYATARPVMSNRLQAITLAGREIGILFVLFVGWRLATGHSLTHGPGAFTRGRRLWDLERRLHLPSEAWVQRGVLAHPLVVRALDLFYLSAHVGGLVILLVWLFFRHRDRYGHWRAAVVASTAIALAIQVVSIAPPRLVPGLGLVDTAARYHLSVYGGPGSSITDQLSSMPSIHVAWAVIIAVAVIQESRSRYRWLVLLHPIITTYVVVATANHYWLDAVAAAAVVAAVLAGQRFVSRCRSGRAPSHQR